MNNEYQEGYDAAIEAIKKALSGQAQSEENAPSVSSDGRDMDLSGTPAGNKMNQSSGGSNLQDSSDDNQNNGGRGSGSQGEVKPEDCTDMSGDDSPNPGGFMDSNEGNKISEAEGYGKDAPSQDSIASQWKDVAQQAAKGHGNTPGNWKEKINATWNTSKDWRKALKKIIGRSLNTQDYRQAYANKNVLVSQDRIARTNKDKFDAVDYIILAVDTSGSMSNNMLSIAASEIYNIALALKPITMVYIELDTKVQSMNTFHNAAEFKKYILDHGTTGRGGTDMHALWDYLRKEKQFKNTRAELVVCVSDGDMSCNSCKRDSKIMENLCWVQFDCPGWMPDTKDAHTTIVHLDSSKIK